MPQISEILKNRESKSFTKKNYRSYDIEGGFPISTNIISIAESEKLSDSQQNEQKDQSELKNSQVTIREQSDNTQVTIREQSDNTQVTIREQSDNTQVTIREQSDNAQVTIREQSDNNPLHNFSATKSFEDPLDKLTQRKTPAEKYLELSGLQKQLIDLFVDICIKNNSFQTGSITSRAVAEHLKTTYGAIKTTIVRLVKKDMIRREQGKSSKVGYINIQLTSELIENSQKYRNYNQLSISESDNNSGNKLDNNTIYSSSNNINTTTLTDEWKNIDFESLKEIGFTITQLKQLISHNTPEIVQNSINHFAYGLKFSDKTKSYSHPLNVLMGVLRKGDGWTEPGYKSPQEIAMEQYLEDKRKNTQRITELKKEIFNVEFTEWYLKIDSKEKSKIFNQFMVPPNIKKSMPEEEIQGLFKEYFKTNIYKESEINFS